MSILTRSTEYAILALHHLGSLKEPRCARSIAAEIAIPEPFLRRVLRTLTRKGYLLSSKGNQGGFSLAKDPEDISVLDLMKAFQGEVTLTACSSKEPPCQRRAACTLGRDMETLNRRILSSLNEVTIASLLEERR